jgi:nitrous oxidase accessory protein
MVVWAALLAVAQTLQVGPGAPYSSIGAALAVARTGDTVRVAPGEYRENLIIDVPIVLIGEGRPVIDGGGLGTVVELRASSRISGFVIRGSGRILDQENAGMLVLADSCEIEDNVLEDVLFGIYLKDSHGSRVVGNSVVGKGRPLGMRGDGIRLWNSNNATVEANVVRHTRDVVVYFSHGLQFRNNRVTHGRYGLHYMYSSNNLFENNEFAYNDVAAFIMYSSDIALRNNVFAAASGHSGFGIGLKDADRIEVTENLIIQNQVGLYFDNSPNAGDAENDIRDNVIAFNDVGVELLPSVRENNFLQNSFVANVRDVSVSGGGTALANRWSGNHWDQAEAWDSDGDGTLDVPYRIDRLSEDLFARHPELQLFQMSPASMALDALGRFFPLLEPRPIVIDSAPSPSSRPLEPTRIGVAERESADPSSRAAVFAALACFGLAGLSLWGVRRWPL